MEVTLGDTVAEDIDYNQNNSGYTGKGVMLGSTNLNKYAATPAATGEYKFTFKDGTITSTATGYGSIDNYKNTSVYMLVPGNSDVVFENMTFNGVVSFDIQKYTSPWSNLNSISFKNCIFNGIIIGTCPASNVTFDGCTFNAYTNATSANKPAAEVVRKIYALCLDGRGPSQIARQLEQEKVLIPTAYYASLGRKTRKQYTNPYAWDQKTVAGILVNQQYTGCTVNFMTTTVSYKVHKTVHKPKDEWQIIPNTQPAIIDEDTWKRVQELREHRIRPTATGRTSLFSGKVFCADCGSKLHFCAAKSLNANQEHYRCSNYKSGRGSCQIHFIRNVVLEKIVLEAINSLADFVRCYEPVFLYLMVQKDIVSKRTETSKLKTAIESGKRRIQDLDKLIERIYEDQVLGNISAERYARMSVNYENEQRTLINKVAEDEKKLACIEQTSLDLKTLLKVLRSSTSFEELTPTLVNSLIRRIEVHNNDKSSGHCYVKVDIYFTAIGLIDIPTEDEIKSLMAKIKANPQEYRLTA